MEWFSICSPRSQHHVGDILIWEEAFFCNDGLGHVLGSYGVFIGRSISNQQTNITPSFVGVVLCWFPLVIVGSLSSIVESR